MVAGSLDCYPRLSEDRDEPARFRRTAPRSSPAARPASASPSRSGWSRAARASRCGTAIRGARARAKAALGAGDADVRARRRRCRRGRRAPRASRRARSARIDVLVCSAGITGPNTTTWEYPVDAWRQVFDVNLNGLFYCNRAVVPRDAGEELRPHRQHRVGRRQGRQSERVGLQRVEGRR